MCDEFVCCFWVMSALPGCDTADSPGLVVWIILCLCVHVCFLVHCTVLQILKDLDENEVHYYKAPFLDMDSTGDKALVGTMTSCGQSICRKLLCPRQKDAAC